MELLISKSKLYTTNPNYRRKAEDRLEVCRIMKIVQKSNPLDKKQDSPSGRICNIPIEPVTFTIQKAAFFTEIPSKAVNNRISREFYGQENSNTGIRPYGMAGVESNWTHFVIRCSQTPNAKGGIHR